MRLTTSGGNCVRPPEWRFTGRGMRSLGPCVGVWGGWGEGKIVFPAILLSHIVSSLTNRPHHPGDNVTKQTHNPDTNHCFAVAC
jgi:hypothetical protein